MSSRITHLHLPQPSAALAASNIVPVPATSASSASAIVAAAAASSLPPPSPSVPASATGTAPDGFVTLSDYLLLHDSRDALAGQLKKAEARLLAQQVHWTSYLGLVESQMALKPRQVSRAAQTDMILNTPSQALMAQYANERIVFVTPNIWKAVQKAHQLKHEATGATTTDASSSSSSAAATASTDTYITPSQMTMAPTAASGNASSSASSSQLPLHPTTPAARFASDASSSSSSSASSASATAAASPSQLASPSMMPTPSSSRATNTAATSNSNPFSPSMTTPTMRVPSALDSLLSSSASSASSSSPAAPMHVPATAATSADATVPAGAVVTSKKVVLVTGANKGIGFQTVRLLATTHPDWTVLLGSRSQSRGEEALRSLSDLERANVRLLIIDVDEDQSIEHAADEVARLYGRLDILINNAAIGGDDANAILRTNVIGVHRVTEAFLPLMPSGSSSGGGGEAGRIIIVSSEVGCWAHGLASVEVRSQLEADTSSSSSSAAAATAALLDWWVKLEALMSRYAQSTQPPAHKDAHLFPDQKSIYGAYGTSKMFLSAYGRMLSAHLQRTGGGPMIPVVVLVCPGYCNTDLNGSAASGGRSAELGARSVLRRIDSPPTEAGRMFCDERELPVSAPLPEWMAATAAADAAAENKKDETKADSTIPSAIVPAASGADVAAVPPSLHILRTVSSSSLLPSPSASPSCAAAAPLLPHARPHDHTSSSSSSTFSSSSYPPTPTATATPASPAAAPTS